MEVGGCGKPTSHYRAASQAVVLVVLTCGQLVYRFHRFFTGFYLIYRACVYLHDRQLLMQPIRSAARAFIYRKLRMQN